MMFNYGFGNGYGCSFGLFHSFWGIGIGLLFVGLLVFLFIRNKRNTNGQNAMESLNLRFAQGEITEDEYLQRKRVLRNK